ncbi:MAG: ribonuclease HII [Bdellovibrionales bacterium]|nr:ribonuclease HII [Bdellovibrionales bacterium]
MFEPVDYQQFNPKPVIGVDEAGRGCLAGPVFAGAVILNFPEKFWDSKSLSPQRREELAQTIKNNHCYGVGTASVEEIDTLNIHRASLLAMKRAVENLNVKGGHLLIDGKFIIQKLANFSQTPLIKGDQRADPIMAASIIAKTERDKLLRSFQKDYPKYMFEDHKGYATKKHKAAIQQYGPCPLHRKSFSGVKEHLAAHLI